MKNGFVVAIDGPAGAGKSTIAKRIAKKLGYIYVDKYNFKKKCKQIVEDIKKELRRKPMDNNGMRTISENEIISRYSQKYNIDRATFETRYLKYLNKLRSKDKSLKEHQNYNEQGKIMKYWFLNE